MGEAGGVHEDSCYEDYDDDLSSSHCLVSSEDEEEDEEGGEESDANESKVFSKDKLAPGVIANHCDRSESVSDSLAGKKRKREIEEEASV